MQAGELVPPHIWDIGENALHGLVVVLAVEVQADGEFFHFSVGGRPLFEEYSEKGAVMDAGVRTRI